MALHYWNHGEQEYVSYDFFLCFEENKYLYFFLFQYQKPKVIVCIEYRCTL